MNSRLTWLGLDKDRVRWFERWQMSLASELGIPVLVYVVVTRQWWGVVFVVFSMVMGVASDVMASLRRSAARASARRAVMQILDEMAESCLTLDQAIFAIMRVMDATQRARWEGSLDRRDPSEAYVRGVLRESLAFERIAKQLRGDQ